MCQSNMSYGIFQIAQLVYAAGQRCQGSTSTPLDGGTGDGSGPGGGSHTTVNQRGPKQMDEDLAETACGATKRQPSAFWLTSAVQHGMQCTCSTSANSSAGGTACSSADLCLLQLSADIEGMIPAGIEQRQRCIPLTLQSHFVPEAEAPLASGPAGQQRSCRQPCSGLSTGYTTSGDACRAFHMTVPRLPLSEPQSSRNSRQPWYHGWSPACYTQPDHVSVTVEAALVFFVCTFTKYLLFLFVKFKREFLI